MEKEIASTKVCWLCRKNEASPNSSMEVSLTHKTIISAAGAQKEKQTIVSIPRCKQCKAIRKKRDNRYFVFTMVGLVVSVGACIYVDVISRGPGWLPWVVGGVLLVLIAIIPPIMWDLNNQKKRDRMSSDERIIYKRAIEYKVENHPAVKRLIEDGWEVG